MSGLYPGNLRPVPELLGHSLADASAVSRTSAYQRFFDPHKAPVKGTVQRPEDGQLDPKDITEGWDKAPNADVNLVDNVEFDPVTYEMGHFTKGKKFDPDVVQDAQVPPNDQEADNDLATARIAACGQIAADMTELLGGGLARLEAMFDNYIHDLDVHHAKSRAMVGANQFDHPDCKPLDILDWAIQMVGCSAISMDYMTWFAISRHPNTIKALGYRPDVNEMKFSEFESRMLDRGVMKVVVSNYIKRVNGARQFVMRPHLHLGSPAQKLVQVRFDGGGQGYRINHQSGIRLCRKPARRPNSVVVPFRALFADIDQRLGRELLPDGFGWQVTRGYLPRSEDFQFSATCRETIVPGPRSASISFTDTISGDFATRMLGGLDLGA